VDSEDEALAHAVDLPNNIREASLVTLRRLQSFVPTKSKERQDEWNEANLLPTEADGRVATPIANSADVQILHEKCLDELKDNPEQLAAYNLLTSDNPTQVIISGEGMQPCAFVNICTSVLKPV
jgi:hypothetical protein